MTPCPKATDVRADDIGIEPIHAAPGKVWDRSTARRRYTAQRVWTSASRILIAGSPLPIGALQARHSGRSA
jgi:hypothetical protein